MIDITMIRVGNKCYNVKTKIDFNEDRSSLKMSVISVDEVNKNSQTSFSKLKTIYVKSMGTMFNNVKYKDIFSKITSMIASKYKVSNIQYY